MCKIGPAPSGAGLRRGNDARLDAQTRGDEIARTGGGGIGRDRWRVRNRLRDRRGRRPRRWLRRQQLYDLALDVILRLFQRSGGALHRHGTAVAGIPRRGAAGFLGARGGGIALAAAVAAGRRRTLEHTGISQAPLHRTQGHQQQEQQRPSPGRGDPARGGAERKGQTQRTTPGNDEPMLTRRPPSCQLLPPGPGEPTAARTVSKR